MDMDNELQQRIDRALADRYGTDIPADIRERVETEMRHIIGNGYGSLLYSAVKLAEYSTARGFPVGIRGLIGNLHVAHLLGIATLDPLDLGLRWEGCLGLAGDWMQPIFLNVAPVLLDDMAAYLAELLPGHDPDGYPTIKLCPHELMSLVGAARQKSGGTPEKEDIFTPEAIARAYRVDVSGIPVLSDLTGLTGFARTLEAKSFPDLVKLMGMCLSDGSWFQLDRLDGDADPFASLIGTREDVYDILVRHGIDADDALRVMQQVRGGYGKLSEAYRDMLESSKSLPGVALEALKSVDYLYPRGQCADYLYWALSLLWYQEHERN